MSKSHSQKTKDEQNTNESGHAKVGFPAKLQAAHRHAPDFAAEKTVQCVATIAHQHDLTADHIATLWKRIHGLRDSANAETPGDESSLQQWGGAE